MSWIHPNGKIIFARNRQLDSLGLLNKLCSYNYKYSLHRKLKYIKILSAKPVLRNGENSE